MTDDDLFEEMMWERWEYEQMEKLLLNQGYPDVKETPCAS